MTRAGPPSGGPDRSIRKNNDPSGSGPSGLHYERNGHGLSEVERTGQTDGGPACVAQLGQAAAGGGWQTDQRGETADFPANRRRRTCRGQHNGGVEPLSDCRLHMRSERTSAGLGTGRVLLQWELVTIVSCFSVIAWGFKDTFMHLCKFHNCYTVTVSHESMNHHSCETMNHE